MESYKLFDPEYADKVRAGLFRPKLSLLVTIKYSVYGKQGWI